ncbi:MAG: hypothetical protein KAH22_07675 [Thiotrichaceae bacterium]|nr:hypothetical protein [Thiotrichaceae bacterium]
MANLQIKGIDDSLYNEIKRLAKEESRSVSQQVLHLIKHWVGNKKLLMDAKTPAEVLLELSGSWLDEKSADEMIEEVKDSCHSSTRFKEIF